MKGSTQRKGNVTYDQNGSIDKRFAIEGLKWRLTLHNSLKSLITLKRLHLLLIKIGQ